MSGGCTPTHGRTAGDLGFAVQLNAETRRNQGTPLAISLKFMARYGEAAA